MIWGTTCLGRAVSPCGKGPPRIGAVRSRTMKTNLRRAVRTPIVLSSMETEPHFDRTRVEQVDRLLSVHRAARAVADSASDWWDRLSEAAGSVITQDTLDGFYRQALTAMQAVLGADEVSILMADADGDALITRASIGLGEDKTVALRIPAGQGMAGRVLASKEPLVVEDLATIRLVSPVLKQQGLRSVVAVPILSDRKILGVLHAGSRQTAHFTAADAELLGLLADRLSVAVERVRLFEEQRQLTKLANFLADTARIMAGASDLVATLEALADAALPTLGDLCLIDMADGEGGIQRLVARHVDATKQPLADRLRDEFPPVANGGHPAMEALRIGGPRWSSTMSDDFLRKTTRDEDHFRLTKELGFRSYLVVPISSADDVLGVLTMVSCTRALNERDLLLAEALARQVGTVVGKAQELERVSLTSRELQAALLPTQLADVAGLTIRPWYAAGSRALEVGGDFYDAFRLRNDEAWVVIGDVEGHDQKAAAVMSQLRSAVRMLALEARRPSDVISRLREAWEYLELPRMATILIGQIDPSTGQVVLASAGHPPPLVTGKGDAFFVPVKPAPPLGVAMGQQQSHSFVLERGQVLLFYTDGVLCERIWGIEEGMEVLRQSASVCEPDVDSLCKRVVGSLPAGDDDIALLAVHRD